MIILRKPADHWQIEKLSILKKLFISLLGPKNEIFRVLEKRSVARSSADPSGLPKYFAETLHHHPGPATGAALGGSQRATLEPHSLVSLSGWRPRHAPHVPGNVPNVKEVESVSYLSLNLSYRKEGLKSVSALLNLSFLSDLSTSRFFSLSSS